MFPFSARLAKENGWSRTFALRAVEEYKRFAFLSLVAGHVVCPSEVALAVALFGTVPLVGTEMELLKKACEQNRLAFGGSGSGCGTAGCATSGCGGC